MLPGLAYPLIASPKYDGIRALSMHNQPISRHAKLLPNKDLQYAFKHMPPLDGEVLVPGDFNKVQSAIMSQSTCIADKFSYFVFEILSRRNSFKFSPKTNTFRFTEVFIFVL